jgi:hypothetical protein
MARKPRVEYAGAFYHVIHRGDQRQVIFRRDADRKHYLELAEQVATNRLTRSAGTFGLSPSDSDRSGKRSQRTSACQDPLGVS